MKVICLDHVDVRVPVNEAFAFVADISRWPVWISPVVCAEQPQGHRVARDAEIVICMQAGRRRWQETFEVTRLMPNAFLSLEGEFSAARRIDFRFEQRGPQTRVTCAMGYRLFGGTLSRWIDSLGRRRRLRHELRDSLVHLKGMLEELVEPGIVGDTRADFMDGIVEATVRPMAPERTTAAAL